MHIYYDTIFSDIGWVVGIVFVLRFLLAGTDAFKAIAKDHNGYVDDIEFALTEAERAMAELHVDLANARDGLSHESEKAQAKSTNVGWPEYHYERDFRPVGPWGIPHNVEMPEDGPLTGTDTKVSPLEPMGKTHLNRDSKTVAAEHAALADTEEMDSAGYPAGIGDGS